MVCWDGGRVGALGEMMKYNVKAALLAVVLSAGLVSCTYDPPTPEASAAAPSAIAESATDPQKSALKGSTLADSFGNADYYTTVDGDTLANVAANFKLSTAKLAQFNGLDAGSALAAGTRLRLIPAAGPITGAMGVATENANGIPVRYTIEADDTLDGITYRFGISDKQLAEANKVPYVYEQGNTYFIRAGRVIELQKNPVDSRSGTGATVNNSFGQTIFYTTVDGDSFDSLGYKFRSTTAQLLSYNPALAADKPIPTGTRVRLMPGELKIDGAQGTFTADAEGIPLTYTTAPGDSERQISFRFSITDLRSANRPLKGDAGTWYEFQDTPSGELVPGQAISLAISKPINR